MKSYNKTKGNGMKNHFYKFRYFTLVELLIVISIIAILAAMLLPALSKARNTARSITCINNQKQCIVAMNMYADTYNGFLALSTSSGKPYGGKSSMEESWLCYLTEFQDVSSDSSDLTWTKNHPAYLPKYQKKIARCPSGKVYPANSFQDARQIYGTPNRSDWNGNNYGGKIVEIINPTGWSEWSGGFMKISAIPAKFGILYDSITREAGINGWQWKSVSKGGWLSKVALRHNMKATVAFADSHVESQTKQKLRKDNGIIQVMYKDVPINI